MAVLSVEFAQLYRPSGPRTIKKNAPALRPAHKVFQENVVLKSLLDIEAVAPTFPVILGVERAVTLDLNPRFT